jgi:hypothetical protein
LLGTSSLKPVLLDISFYTPVTLLSPISERILYLRGVLADFVYVVAIIRFLPYCWVERYNTSVKPAVSIFHLEQEGSMYIRNVGAFLATDM